MEAYESTLITVSGNCGFYLDVHGINEHRSPVAAKRQFESLGEVMHCRGNGFVSKLFAPGHSDQYADKLITHILTDERMRARDSQDSWWIRSPHRHGEMVSTVLMLPRTASRGGHPSSDSIVTRNAAYTALPLSFRRRIGSEDSPAGVRTEQTRFHKPPTDVNIGQGRSPDRGSLKKSPHRPRKQEWDNAPPLGRIR
jgi:hypothetical protein